jgi:uncharacterized phage protein (TIGR02218 family)
MADVEITTFACGLRIWRYTNALLPVSYLGNVYTPASIKRGAIEVSGDLEKAQLIITVPVTLDFMDLFRPAPPLRKIFVTVQRLTRGDTTARTIWSGTVGSPDSGPHTVAITCFSVAAAQQNNGLRRKWSRTCTNTLYLCGVDRTGFRVDGMLTGASGNTVQAAAFAAYPDHYFVGGFIEWTLAGDQEWRFITGHIGDTLTLLTTSTLAVGQAVQAYPGCDHSDGANGCGRFGNILNYGGQLYIPNDNPFSSTRVL